MSRPNLALFARAAIAADANSGEILFTKHPFRKLPPASMTKIMTLLLAMERLQQRKINWTDQVIVSKQASLIHRHRHGRAFSKAAKSRSCRTAEFFIF